MKKKVKYVEPIDYFPKEIREKYKLGEYSDINKKELKEKNEIQDENKKEEDNEENNKR